MKGIQLIPQYHRDVKGVAIEIPKNLRRKARLAALWSIKAPPEASVEGASGD
jgi:hypothetical protein